MSGKIYLRPVGVIWGDVAAAAIAEGAALPLAGGPAAFLGAQLIEGVPGRTARRQLSARDIAASAEPQIRATLDRLTAPRPPIAGLALNRPLLMGIVNVTPDSFSDGGDFAEAGSAEAQARRLAAEGADIIDIGGESTRPGAAPVDAAEELARILPVLAGLRGLPTPISIDTRKAALMTAAVAGGAAIINDVSALTYDPGALAAAARSGVPIVLMHALGDPRTMQDQPAYADVLLEVYDYLAARIEACEAAGIPRRLLIADPGIGFGKTLEHNLALMAGIALFHGLGVPVLLGASRKRFIGAISGVTDPKRRSHGSVAAALAAAAEAVQVLRVHDVAATREALDVWRASVQGRWQPR
ncbi:MULTISPECIES: dihydropteroate synthase [Rhodomicrobium]|uniref:dihydropteroate synthase n=1 Tax=Rhodomicrobium TaxID=1068 RepID=UPI000B4AD7F6|nr:MULTISPECIES: dihydropteroate synthase [Rhodomicrobium]